MNEQPGSEPKDPGATDPGPDPAPPPNPAPPPAPDSLPPVAGGPPAPPDLPPGVYPAPPDLPPGVYPAAFTQPGDQPGGPAGPAPKRSRRARGIAAAAVVGLVAAFAKFGLPLLIGVAATGVIGNIFGGPYGRLPSDQQQALDRRYTAAVGNRFDGISDAQRTEQVNAMIQSGMPRLGDDPLVERLHLTAKLGTAADEATCARLARSIASGKGDAESTRKALEALDVASIGRWFDINIQAIEAEAASTPVRTIDAAAADRIVSDVIGSLSEAETAQVMALYGTAPASDADACGAMRAFYRHMEALPPADLATAALYDVLP